MDVCALMHSVEIDEKRADKLDFLISECGGMIARLEQLEKAAILNVVKWGLQAELVKLKDLQEGLLDLAREVDGTKT